MGVARVPLIYWCLHSNHVLANYEYVYQCLKFSEDVRLVLIEKDIVRIGLTPLVGGNVVGRDV